MAPIGTTVLSHIDGVSDSARARELYRYECYQDCGMSRNFIKTEISRYYQPAGPINQENCFPVQEDGTATFTDVPITVEATSQEINIQSDVVSSKISSPDTALTAFCQLVTWRIGAQRAMIR